MASNGRGTDDERPEQRDKRQGTKGDERGRKGQTYGAESGSRPSDPSVFKSPPSPAPRKGGRSRLLQRCERHRFARGFKSSLASDLTCPLCRPIPLRVGGDSSSAPPSMTRGWPYWTDSAWAVGGENSWHLAQPPASEFSKSGAEPGGTSPCTGRRAASWGSIPMWGSLRQPGTGEAASRSSVLEPRLSPSERGVSTAWYRVSCSAPWKIRVKGFERFAGSSHRQAPSTSWNTSDRDRRSGRRSHERLDRSGHDGPVDATWTVTRNVR
jgi:hypothetical protein